MTFHDINSRGLVLLGCGKMGSALLQGWLAKGILPESVWVIDPFPSDWLKATGVKINMGLPDDPAVLLVAVKPQMMDEALDGLDPIKPTTLVISVAAGTPLTRYEASFGSNAPIVRTMPNTPASVGQGITAIVGNAAANATHLDLSDKLLSAVGQTVRLDTESQMDAVTAVSGSGPAYVFHMIECMAEAGRSQGLSADLAMQLAKATVAGAGALAVAASESPEQLRINVTSPNGTTQAGLEQLMDSQKGLAELIQQTVAAAADRSRELGS